MDMTIIVKGQPAGVCSRKDAGLYWEVDCSFRHPSADGVRLFCGGRSMGLAERAGEQWILHRRVSKVSAPELSVPEHRILALQPYPEQVEAGEYTLNGYVENGERGRFVRFPYFPDRPHPCMPLFCFFSVEDGFWVLKLDEEGVPIF